MTQEELAMAILDAFERVGSRQDYYRLNHASRQHIEALAEFMIKWCREIGISIEKDQHH